MRRTHILFAIAFSVPSISLADITDAEFARCAVVDGDLQRLECFDRLARENNLDGPQAEATGVQGAGKWDVRAETNPIDDSRTVTLVLMADSGSSRFRESVFLIARCQSNTTEVYINWNDYLGSEAEVTSRVGSATANTQRWGLSTDKQATFHPRPIAFLRSMLDADRFVAQVTPYNESPTTAVFDVRGLDNAIRPLRETCSW